MSAPAPRRTRRAALATLGVIALTALPLTACSAPAPTDPGSTTATLWSLTSGDQPALEAAIERWNSAHPDARIEAEFFASDAYKPKIRTAIGADRAPTLIFNWSGGVLEGYVRAGAVEDLSDLVETDPELRDRYLPSILQNGYVDGKPYALPMNKVNPTTMFYNTELLNKAGVDIPTTWDELMDIIPRLKDIGVAPIALGGQSKWPELIWLEYLVNREGGDEVWNRVLAGEEGAWDDPAVLGALEKIQDLVKAGAFQDNFASTASNSGSELALLYTGKAAICLQISSQYQTMKQAAPDFITSGALAWAPFPTIEGGSGDPTYVVGSPSNFFSISSSATEGQKATARAFLTSGLFDDAYIEDIIGTGAVPPLADVASKLTATDDAPFLDYVYTQASEASTFELSWDQALDPAVSDPLLSNLGLIFLLQQTPEEFVAAMNKASGL
jgi:raffinose/stachyose/melibiose transport system substrate-binding protein